MSNDKEQQMMHIRLNTELHRQLRIMAAELNTTVRAVVELELSKAMSRYFERRRK